MPNCRHCGAEVPPDAGSCTGCGTPVAAGAASGPATRVPQANHTTDAPNQGESQRNRPPRFHEAGAPNQGQPRRRSRRQPAGQSRPGGGQGMPVTTGIRIVAGLLGLLGLSQVLFGFMTMNAGGTASRFGANRAGGAMLLIGLVLLGIGVGAFVAAYGLWTFRPWGWTAAGAFFGVGAAMSILLALTAGSVGGLVMAVAWNLGPFWYLWTVQERYGSLSRQHHGTPDQPRTPASGAARPKR